MTPTLSPHSRTPQGEQTAERILDVAEALFAQHGFAGTKLREVAREAGIRAPSLYNHFPSKEALYAAVLERALRPTLQMLESFLADGDPAAPQGPRELELVDQMMSQLAARPNLGRLIYHEVLTGHTGLNPIVSEWLRSLYGHGLRALAQRTDKGPWTPEELPRLLFTMAATFSGYFALAPGYAAAFGGEPLAAESLARQSAFLRKFWRRVW